MRSRRLEEKYGISEEDYCVMLVRQNFRCYICHKIGDLVVDHNHETRKVRALLCAGCNSAIGFAKEDISILENMISYIKEFN